MSTVGIRVGRLGPARRAIVADVLLWVALSLPVAFAVLSPPLRPYAAAGRLVVSLAAMALAVVLARRAPLASLIIVVVGSMGDGNFSFAIPVMSYLVGRRTERAGPAAWTFGAIALGGTALNLGLLDTGAQTWFLLATTLLFVGVFPWLVGRYRRQHQQLLLAGWQRAEQWEREWAILTDQVRLRERARIAQDMHDSLGHELSLIALRAGALEVAASLDDRHRAAAAELRTGAAAATDRLAEIIGVLRDDTEASAAAPLAPVDESLSTLVERARRSGMRIRLRYEGTDGGNRAPGGNNAPAGDHGAPSGCHGVEVADAFPTAGVQLAAHRVVQEALTNATKHAPGAEVSVTVERRGTELVVAVANGPPPAGRSLIGPPSAGRSPAGAEPAGAPGQGPPGELTPAVRGGLGLVGLRERVRLAGGSLRAGPHDGGFQLVARLPLSPPRPPEGGPPDHAVQPASPPHPAVRAWPAGTALPSAPAEPGDAALSQVRRRLRRSLTLAVLGPPLAAVVLSLAYYPFAVFDRVLPDEDFDRLRVGQQRAELAAALPGRQALQRPLGGRPAPAGAICEYYTDGNFPLAGPSFRLCFAAGRLVAKDDLREGG